MKSTFRMGEKVWRRPHLHVTYVIIAHRPREPRWQIQRGRTKKSREWVLTEDLESLDRP